jgi:hypothetical protein
MVSVELGFFWYHPDYPATLQHHQESRKRVRTLRSSEHQTKCTAAQKAQAAQIIAANPALTLGEIIAEAVQQGLPRIGLSTLQRYLRGVTHHAKDDADNSADAECAPHKT